MTIKRADMESVRAAINSDKGTTWYSVNPSRSYKQGEEWKQADSYGSDDLLLLAKLLDQAHSWIISQLTKQHAA